MGRADVNCWGICIRPVFTTISREDIEKKLEEDTKKAYSLLQTSNNDSFEKKQYQYFQEQCNIREEEKCHNKPSYYGAINFDEGKTQRDQFGVIYSLDGKRLLDASNCDCEIYTIKEGTEYICDRAFIKEDEFDYHSINLHFSDWPIATIKEKKDFVKIILPSTLQYFPRTAIPPQCAIESNSPNYSVINGLIIDTRKNSVVMCTNRLIQKVEICEPIEEIESYAFFDCELLQEGILPETLRVIGDSAFRHCENLTRINLPASVNIISKNAFMFCKSLRINSLPRHLSYIGDDAFYGCNINDVIIPRCIEDIGIKPFSRNVKTIISESSRFIIDNSLLIDFEKKEVIQLIDSSIRKVTIPSYIHSIRGKAFWGTDIETITIPSNVIDLGDGLFSNCKELREVRLDCEIERLPAYMFFGCTSLSSFSVHKSIKTIGKGAFKNCKNLFELFFKQGLQHIEDSAFAGCENLRIVNIKYGLRSIGPKAFAGCTKLSSINFPESIEKIGEHRGDYSSGDCFKECLNLRYYSYEATEAEIAMNGLPKAAINITIGNNVKTLPQYFLFESEITQICIPNNVRCLKKGCISYCNNLKEISIASKEIDIEEGWIRDCKNLNTVRLYPDVYDKLLPVLPKGNRIRVKKLYDHHFLFFKW